MTESDAKEPDSPVPAAGEATADERLAHCKVGYDNSQAVVRFLDTKATAVIGAIPIVITALAALANMVKDWAAWRSAFAAPRACLLWIAVVSTVLAAVILLSVAVRAIIAAFEAITPRNTGDAKPSVLFPFDATYKHDAPDDSFRSRARFIVEKSAKTDLLSDYERQLVRMGEIVAQKVLHVNAAVKQLKAFFAVAAVLLALIFATSIVAAALSPREASPTTPPAAPATMPATSPTSMPSSL